MSNWKSIKLLFISLLFNLAWTTPASAIWPPVVIDPPESQEEMPWQSSAGGWLMVNLTWPNYNAGFDFTPTSDGHITKLGGLFNGAKTVRLYNSSGTVIAQATVSGNNSWSYADISPVPLVAGERYTIAVNTGWSGASMYYGMGFPYLPTTTGHITIERSVFGFDSQHPKSEIWGQMWGQPDFAFVPGPIIVIQ